MYSVFHMKNLKQGSLLACSAKASFLKELLSVAYNATAVYDNVLYAVLRMAWLCVYVHMVNADIYMSVLRKPTNHSVVTRDRMQTSCGMRRPEFTPLFWNMAGNTWKDTPVPCLPS